MFRRVLATAPAQASRALASATRPTTSTFARAAAPSIQQAVSKRSYHEKVLDHYNNPRNVGSMGKGDSDVGTGLVGAPACGDVMKLQIKVDPNDNTISDVKFKTFGCGSAIASSSYLTELVRGMTLEQAGRIKNTEIAKELCLPPVKRTSTFIIEHPSSLTNIPPSPLLHACRRRHQIRHQQLLHQEPQSQGHRPRRHRRCHARD